MMDVLDRRRRSQSQTVFTDWKFTLIKPLELFFIISSANEKEAQTFNFNISIFS